MKSQIVKGRARRRPLPLPSSPAHSGELANQILVAVLETGDHIGTTPCGGSHSYGWEQSHFLLIEIDDRTFRQLMQHGAEDEDDEPDHDNEEDHDNEPEGYAE